MRVVVVARVVILVVAITGVGKVLHLAAEVTRAVEMDVMLTRSGLGRTQWRR